MKITNRPEVGKRYKVTQYRNGVFDRDEGEMRVIEVHPTFFVGECQGVRIAAGYEGVLSTTDERWMRSFEEVE